MAQQAMMMMMMVMNKTKGLALVNSPGVRRRQKNFQEGANRKRIEKQHN